MMYTGSTTNITRLNRVNSRRTLIYCGNQDGIISYGKGKGKDYKQAFDKAILDCKKNLIAIPVDI